MFFFKNILQLLGISLQKLEFTSRSIDRYTTTQYSALTTHTQKVQIQSCSGRKQVTSTLGKYDMTDQLLQNVEKKLDQLLNLCDELQQENQHYKDQESDWNLERSRLIEKNEVARTRVEAMITRLKSLETDA